MHQLKVKFNDTGPTPNLIGKYKNFDHFIDGYKKFHTPSGIRYLFRYDIKKLVFVVIIVLLLLMLLLTESNLATF
jgi:hypothetical protein